MVNLKFWAPAPPRLNYFRLVKSALDRCVTSICEEKDITPDQARKEMTEHLKTFGDQYRTHKKPQNSYETPLCRAAYLYCYVPANANLCEIAINRSPDVVKLIKKRLEEDDELKVCAFGG